MLTARCPNCESTVPSPGVAFGGKAVGCPECDFPVAVQPPTQKFGYWGSRSPLKRLILVCCICYFVLSAGFFIIEMVREFPDRAYSVYGASTILAIACLIWASREDQPNKH